MPHFFLHKKSFIILAPCLLFILISSAFLYCKDDRAYQSPPGYDLNNPQKFVLNQSLHEISGIAFLQGNSDTVYAIQDEDGRIFYFHLGSGDYPYSKFSGSGDYEDVTILNDRDAVVLRSDGALFMFSVTQIRNKKIDSVNHFKNVLPKGEYEGLFGDENGNLLVLCKSCPADEGKNQMLVYSLQYGENGFSITDVLRINIKEELKSIKEKRNFRPSCLARHPLTRDLYIVSSVNHTLVVLNEKWEVKEIYFLKPSLFKQPEGLAFDKKGNMYISNEGGQGSANILVFEYASK